MTDRISQEHGQRTAALLLAGRPPRWRQPPKLRRALPQRRTPQPGEHRSSRHPRRADGGRPGAQHSTTNAVVLPHCGDVVGCTLLNDPDDDRRLRPVAALRRLAAAEEHAWLDDTASLRGRRFARRHAVGLRHLRLRSCAARAAAGACRTSPARLLTSRSRRMGASSSANSGAVARAAAHHAALHAGTALATATCSSSRAISARARHPGARWHGGFQALTSAALAAGRPAHRLHLRVPRRTTWSGLPLLLRRRLRPRRPACWWSRAAASATRPGAARCAALSRAARPAGPRCRRRPAVITYSSPTSSRAKSAARSGQRAAAGRHRR